MAYTFRGLGEKVFKEKKQLKTLYPINVFDFCTYRESEKTGKPIILHRNKKSCLK